MIEGKGKMPQRHKKWRAEVAEVARRWMELKGEDPWDGPIEVRLVFYLDKPKSKPQWKIYPDTSFDIDKLSRSVLDSLTGPMIVNDSRVVTLRADKWYTGDIGPGVEVWVTRLEEPK